MARAVTLRCPAGHRQVAFRRLVTAMAACGGTPVRRHSGQEFCKFAHQCCRLPRPCHQSFFCFPEKTVGLLEPPPGSGREIANIFGLFWLNGASLFGRLKRKLGEKRGKIGPNPLILFVDSTFQLIYSHRNVGKSREKRGKSKIIQQKKEEKETSQSHEKYICS